jgi:hypothetical protein
MDAVTRCLGDKQRDKDVGSVVIRPLSGHAPLSIKTAAVMHPLLNIAIDALAKPFH